MDGNYSQKLEKGSYIAEIHPQILEGLIHSLSTLVLPPFCMKAQLPFASTL